MGAAAVTVTGAAAVPAVMAIHNKAALPALGGSLGWRMIEHAKAAIGAFPRAGLMLGFVSVDCMSKEDVENFTSCGLASYEAHGHQGGWRMEGKVTEGEEIEVAGQIEDHLAVLDGGVNGVAGGVLRLEVIHASEMPEDPFTEGWYRSARGGAGPQNYRHPEIDIVIGERPAEHRDDFRSEPASVLQGFSHDLRLDSAHPLSVTEAKIEKLGEEMIKRANEATA